MTNTRANAIHLENLSKTYPGSVEAVRDISLSVAPGEVFGLLGPNGAGKSTTVGMLTTTIVPTAGRALVAGFDVGTRPIEARLASAVVFQDPVVDRMLSGRRNLAVHARLWGLDSAGARRRIEAVIDAFDLGAIVDRNVATYSGGQRRRLEIARGLVSDPQVLFLDEPTVGLDPRFRAELLDLIAGMRAGSDMTILLTTHYLDEAEQLCDRVAIVHEGRVVALDRPAALLAALGREVVELRIDGDAAAAVRALRARGLAGDDTFAVGATLRVPVPEGAARRTVDAIGELGLPVAAVTTRPPTLDDVYLQLTGSSLAA